MAEEILIIHAACISSGILFIYYLNISFKENKKRIFKDREYFNISLQRCYNINFIIIFMKICIFHFKEYLFKNLIPLKKSNIIRNFWSHVISLITRYYMWLYMIIIVYDYNNNHFGSFYCNFLSLQNRSSLIFVVSWL